MTERPLDITDKSSPEIQTITTRDGRQLAYESTGDPDGDPVFLLHGTPAGRKGIKPRPFKVAMRGVWMTSYDRPGYGDSDRQEGRSVVDAAEDVRELADHLGYERFAIVGKSGGTPHALACAAKLSERVTHTVALSGLAPPEDMLWYLAMSPSNDAAFGKHEQQDKVIRDIMGRARRARNNPENILKELEPEMAEFDRDILSDPHIRQQVVESFREALKQGPGGWIDDVLAFRKEWGFDLKDIQSPVTFWTAERDPFNPVSYARAMAAQVLHSELMIQPDASHFNSIEVLPYALSLAAGPESSRIKGRR